MKIDVGPAAEVLVEAAQTYAQKRLSYGPTEHKYADAMLALFPAGVRLVTHDDFVRFGILTQMISKLCRYTNTQDGHMDSGMDLTVYTAMLQAEDRRIQK